MDQLRLQIVPAGPDAGGGFAVEIYINGAEVTTKGAGMGMDPYDILIPSNRLLPTSRPSQVPVARCTCGVYGCGETDVVVTSSATTVDWEWLKEKPGIDRSQFDRDAYVLEVARARADLSWETPERAAGRMILEGVEGHLPLGLRPDWVGNYWRDETLFRVCLRLDQHQIFVDFEWNGRTPDELAADATSVLTTVVPASWRASWHPIQRGSGPPPIAGPTWTQAQIP